MLEQLEVDFQNYKRSKGDDPQLIAERQKSEMLGQLKMALERQVKDMRSQIAE